MNSYIKTRDAKQEHYKTLLKKPNVIGVGVGNKIVNGRSTDELSIKVYVGARDLATYSAGARASPSTS